ncbi:hypothetical protein BC834DRAFT_1038932 [Gloeopeniophorella convolvens]|nr:hypothetical protein BC834DRAFT_1038932 [Gloeopeniophorella convolvens]
MNAATTQHPPAIRVGGRRLSLPSRPRPHPHADEAALASPGEPADYPRPAAPGTEAHVEHVRNEDEPLKRERRKSHGAHENERRLRENAQRKVDENRQRKDQQPGGAKVNARISQPGGKVAI